MATLVRLAIRNVSRHPRRTAITAAAVALGVVFMIVASGFLDFTFWGLRQSMIHGGLGHLQILPPEGEVRPRLGPDLVAAVETLLATNPAVETVAPRLEFQGLVSAGSRTLTFSGVGVDAVDEARVRSAMLLSVGGWFTGTERVPRALIGGGLARRLQVGLHDVVSLVTYSDRGAMSATDVQVAGIFESGVIEYDARTLLVPLATARDLMESDALSALVVMLHEGGALDSVVRSTERGLARWRGMRVARWEQLSPIYDSVVQLYQWVLDVFLVIVTAVVVLGIANTMSMAVLERVAEIGVLRALGFGALRIVMMLLFEAGTIGAIGSAAGVALGVVACRVISAMGFEMPPPPGHSQGYLAEVHVVPRALAMAAAIAMASALGAAVAPAVRSIRREVSDALRAT